MRLVDYTDERGRKYRVELPDDAPDEEAYMGVPIGPPDAVDAIGLPDPLATRLHNMLFDHKLWDAEALKKSPRNVLFGILQRALKVDVNILYNEYRKLKP